MRVAITGVGRGIGLELLSQLLMRGDQVEASTREPARSPGLSALQTRFPDALRVSACDVGSDSSVEAWAGSFRPGPLDLLFNNAGVASTRVGLRQLQLADVQRLFEVNALGALRVTRALLPRLLEGSVRKVACLSSIQGSIEKASGSSYGYRISKAALNMAGRTLAEELASEQVTVVLLHPGWVQTDMGGAQAPVKVGDSAAGILQVVDALTPARSGAFLDYTGATLPW